MFFNLRKFIARSYFDSRVSGILNTVTVNNFSNNGPVLLSMVQHKDLLMYLLAAKSFVQYVQPKRFVVVADSSLTESDKSTIKHHLGRVEIISCLEFQCEKIPIGGTWERLHAISLLCHDDYVIQLDSDTLTISEPTLVKKCLVNNQPFTLGTKTGQVIESFEEHEKSNDCYDNGKRLHIQPTAESLLSQICPKHMKFYVRGCSGFTGFAKASIRPADLYEVSKCYESVLGSRWHEWGTEQFTSNLLIANTENSIVLPNKYYDSADNYSNKLSFIHFIGFARFKKGIYVEKSIKVISELSIDKSN